MGSGKTMFLKANLAYHLYSIVPAILEGLPITLPVFLPLSDFQHLATPAEIYRGVILRIIEELSKTYLTLEDCNRMSQIHQGMQSLPVDYFRGSKLSSVLENLTRLSSDEYLRKITTSLGLAGAAKPHFLELSAKFAKDSVTEMKQKTQPGIADVRHAFQTLLGETGGQILLLIDEAGSVARSFFVGEGQTSLFETLMNQLRTAEFVRTKIAIYPHTYSDILVETRYGDLVDLGEDILDDSGYRRFRRKVLSLIGRYASAAVEMVVRPAELFDVAGDTGTTTDAVEQVINASGGNMRRLMGLLDLSMGSAFEQHQGTGKVTVNNVLDALKRHSGATEALYTDQERDFLRAIANTCKSRRTFRFQFPNRTPALYKYTAKSDEHNILNVIEAGIGRRSTTYGFDYAYCVNHDVPTHYIKGSERIDETRSRRSGEWITRVTRVSEELLQHATMFAKIEGVISFISRKGSGAFISGDDGDEYYLDSAEIIGSDRAQQIVLGRRVKFYPVKGTSSNPEAALVELL